MAYIEYMDMEPIIGNYLPSQGNLEVVRKLKHSMTPAECILWSRLRANKLDNFHFRRQQLILGFVADFYCHRARLIIEVDGSIHETQVAYDYDRDRLLSAGGCCLLRFSNDQVISDLRSVMLKILVTSRLLERELHPPNP